MNDYVQTLSTWKTPATSYERRQCGSFRIKEVRYSRAYYPCYGLQGAALVKATKAIPVTILEERRNGKWEPWMVDDPPHWWAMQLYASKAAGRVLTAGLGLGLFHQEVAKNESVSEVVAVERSPEVLSLVGPYLPPKVRAVVADFRDFIKQDTEPWDFVLLDLWVAHGIAEKLKLLYAEVLPLKEEVKQRFPNATVAVHGFVTASDIRWPISAELMEVIRQVANVAG